jgi:hypothetical protein
MGGWGLILSVCWQIIGIDGLPKSQDHEPSQQTLCGETKHSDNYIQPIRSCLKSISTYVHSHSCSSAYSISVLCDQPFIFTSHNLIFDLVLMLVDRLE